MLRCAPKVTCGAHYVVFICAWQSLSSKDVHDYFGTWNLAQSCNNTVPDREKKGSLSVSPATTICWKRRSGTLKEKECCNCGKCFHGWACYRRTALEGACGSPSVRQSQMWNGDLNGQRAKATNQVILGMTDVKQQSTSINGWGCWW